MNVPNRSTDEDFLFHFPQDPFDMDKMDMEHGANQRQLENKTIRLDNGNSVFLHVIRSDDFILVFSYKAHEKRSNMALRVMTWLSPCGMYKLKEWEEEPPLSPNVIQGRSVSGSLLQDDYDKLKEEYDRIRLGMPRNAKNAPAHVRARMHELVNLMRDVRSKSKPEDKHPLYPNLHIMTIDEISQLDACDKVVHAEARITADPPRKSTKPYIRRLVQSIHAFDILFPPLHAARKFDSAELEMHCNSGVFLFGRTVHTGPHGLFKTLNCASSTPETSHIGEITDSWHALHYYNDSVLNGFKKGPSSEAIKALRVYVDLGTLKYVKNTTFKYIYEYLADGIVGNRLSVACADFQLPIEALAFLANKGECGYYVASLILCAKGNHDHLMWSIFG